MSQRSQRSAEERLARSQLAQRITEQPFLRGSLIESNRSCGKPTCRCQHGQRHRSLYLAVNHRGQRARLYVPRALEATVRQWVANGQRIEQQLQALHQHQLEQWLQRKHHRPAHQVNHDPPTPARSP